MSFTSKKQDEAFAALFRPADDALATAIEWMQENLAPDDVFGKAALAEWAESNGYEKTA